MGGKVLPFRKILNLLLRGCASHIPGRMPALPGTRVLLTGDTSNNSLTHWAVECDTRRPAICLRQFPLYSYFLAAILCQKFCRPAAQTAPGCDDNQDTIPFAASKPDRQPASDQPDRDRSNNPHLCLHECCD